MPYSLPSQIEPLRLRGPQLFVDWRHVSEGEVAWEQAGQPIGIWDVPPPQMTARASVPYGIRLEMQRAENLGPIFDLDKPWEQFYLMYVSTVLYEAGKYRMWYVVVPADHRIPPDFTPRETGWNIGYSWMVCYAESEDGFTWTKPKLGLAPYLDETQTNFVYGRQLSPHGFSSGSVFKDSGAHAAERYKLLYRTELKSANRETQLAKLHARFGAELDLVALGEHTSLGSDRVAGRGVAAGQDPLRGTAPKAAKIGIVAGAVSPDGIHWTGLPEPLMVYHSNQLNNAYWDAERRCYVGYFRMERSGRRSVGRSETADFNRWPAPEPVLEAPLDWRPSDDIYHCPVALYPGSNDTYLMAATVYHRHTDSRDVYMASSVDGLSWRFVPGGPAAALGAPGSWCGGDLHAGCGIVPLPGRRVGVPIVGYHLPHKHPRWVGRPVGSPGWAAWPEGRISALVADDVGEFATHRLLLEGRELSLNFRVPAAGSILVEMRDEQGQPVSGFEFSDADPLTGDTCDKRVTWRGDANLGALAGKPVSFAFRLRSAHLFAFEVVA